MPIRHLKYFQEPYSYIAMRLACHLSWRRLGLMPRLLAAAPRCPRFLLTKITFAGHIAIARCRCFRIAAVTASRIECIFPRHYEFNCAIIHAYRAPLPTGSRERSYYATQLPLLC